MKRRKLLKARIGRAQISRQEFLEAHHTPVLTATGSRSRGFHTTGFNIQREDGFVDWSCQACNHRNHHKDFGRDVYVCSNCSEGYDLK